MNAGPYDIHQQFYYATDAQRAALAALQDSAVKSILALHGLPAGDYQSVLGWDPSEIRAVMWEELQQALTTPAGSRTATQQAGVDYLGVLLQREAVQAAVASVREYNKWTGSASYINLPYSKLSANPQGGASTSPNSPPGSGFCQYHPPGPYDSTSEYDGRSSQQCFTPCVSVFSCSLPQPSYDQFVSWGTWDANNNVDATYASVASQTAGAIALAAAAAGSPALGAAAAAALPAAALDSIAAVVSPFGGIAPSFVQLAAEPIAAAAADGAAFASSLAAAVGIAVAALTTAVVEGLQVVQQAALPAQLNQLLSNAQAGGPGDAAAVNGSTAGSRALYSLFLGATTPESLGGPTPAAGTPDVFVTKSGRQSTLQFTDGNGLTQSVRSSGGWFYVTVTDKDGKVLSKDQPTLFLNVYDPLGNLPNPSKNYWKIVGSDGTPQVVGIQNDPKVLTSDLDNCGADVVACSVGSTLTVNTPTESDKTQTEAVMLLTDQITLSPTNVNTVAGYATSFTASVPGPGGASRDVTGAATFTIDGQPCKANLCTATTAGPHTVTVTAGDQLSTASTQLSVTAAAATGLTVTTNPTSLTAGQAFSVTVHGHDPFGNDTGDVTANSTVSLCSSDGSCAPCPQAGCAALQAAAGQYLTVYDGTLYQQLPITILAGPVTQMRITTAGGGATAGATAGGDAAAGSLLTFTAYGADAQSDDLGDVTAGTSFQLNGVPCTANVCTMPFTAGVGGAVVTATDGAASTSATFNVVAGKAVAIQLLPPAPLASSSSPLLMAGAPMYVNWNSIDQYGNVGPANRAGALVSLSGGTCDIAFCHTTADGVQTLTVTTADGVSGSEAVLINPAAPDHLTLSGAVKTTAGAAVVFTPTEYDQYGNAVDGAVATEGQLTMTQGSCTDSSCVGYVAGDQTVSVTYNGFTATAPLHIDPDVAISLSLAPSTTTPAAGAGFTVTARGVDAYGNDTGDLTTATTFALAGGSCSTSSCTSTAAGPAALTAQDGSLNGTASLTIGAAPLATVNLHGASSTVAGTPVTYTVTGADHYGNPVVTSIVLTIGNGTCTAMTCTATKTGTTTVTATSGAVTGSAQLTVTPAPLASLAPAGGDQQIAVTGHTFTQPLSVTAADAYGNIPAPTTVTFTLSGGGATFTGGHTTATALTTASGVATSPPINAGATPGPLTIAVTAAGATGATLHLTVNPPNSAPTITGIPALATAGTPYRYAFTTTGFPAPTVTLTAGTLPVGLNLNAAGVITGTTTKAGIYLITITAANSTKTVSRPAVILVAPSKATTVRAATGSGQTATTKTKFPTRLTAAVTDTYGNPVPAVPVHFTISGPATFPNAASSATEWTGLTGTATAPPITAGNTHAHITITATTTGATTATFTATINT